MPIIFATHDKSGFAGTGTGTSNWNLVHDAGESKNASFATELGVDGVLVSEDGSTVTLHRAFFEFNTPGAGLPAGNIESLTLNIKGYGSNNDLDIIVIEGTQTAPYGIATFNDFTGWQSGWNNTHVTAYSDEITSWNNSAYNSIPLNSTAIAALQANEIFKVCVMSYDYDYLDVTPSGVDQAIDIRLQGSGTSNDPYIEYTLGNPADIAGPFRMVSGGKFKISAGRLTIK